jgi:hypothetical protein
MIENLRATLHGSGIFLDRTNFFCLLTTNHLDEQMNYVVGFLGGEGHLGRTFHANNMDEAVVALRELFMEQKDTFPFVADEEVYVYFADRCVLKTELGFYFVGGLEKVD